MCRSPWCSKEGLNRGAWSAEEDMILWEYIRKHGDGGWSKVPQKTGLKRCGKSCRLRWVNYVRPDIRRGNICPDEEELICRLHRLLGNRWSLIAGRLPGRTGNEIKNYWNTHLKKKLLNHESQPKTMSKSPSPIQNHVFKTTPVGITTAKRHTEMETANCCSNRITSDHALKLSTIEANAYSSRSGCNLPGYDSIREDDSESIAFPMENVDLVEADQGRNSMSSLVVQQSPQSDHFAGLGDTRAESLFDPNEPSSPDFNLLSSPSIWTDFGLHEFLMGLPPNEPYSPDFNMLSYPSISTDFGLEELYMGLPTSLDAETSEFVF